MCVPNRFEVDELITYSDGSEYQDRETFDLSCYGKVSKLIEACTNWVGQERTNMREWMQLFLATDKVDACTQVFCIVQFCDCPDHAPKIYFPDDLFTDDGKDVPND